MDAEPGFQFGRIPRFGDLGWFDESNAGDAGRVEFQSEKGFTIADAATKRFPVLESHPL